MMQRVKHLILFIFLVIIDQGTKFWVKQSLMNQEPIIIIPKVFKLQYHENTGAVWGIMSGKTTLLSVFTFFILLFIVFIYLKIPQAKKYNPLKVITVFIIAGAVGNLIDRVFLGYVVDFIYFELINFPLFNVADSFLTVSCVILFLLVMFHYKDEDFVFVEQFLGKKKQKSNTIADSSDDKIDDSEDN